MVHLVLCQVSIYITFGYGFTIVNRDIGDTNMVLNDFFFTIVFNVISFIGILLLLAGANPVVGGSLVTLGLFAFVLQILFHKI